MDPSFSQRDQPAEVYRFRPTDEILLHYLKRRLHCSEQLLPSPIVDFDIYSDHPSNILDSTKEARIMQGGDIGIEGYFFTSPKTTKNGKRIVERWGTWGDKSTPKKIEAHDRSCDQVAMAVGFKRQLKFVPSSKSALNQFDWLMHEYCLEERKDVVLCHIIRKVRRKNLEQEDYGSNEKVCTQNCLANYSSIVNLSDQVPLPQVDFGDTATDYNNMRFKGVVNADATAIQYNYANVTQLDQEAQLNQEVPGSKRRRVEYSSSSNCLGATITNSGQYLHDLLPFPQHDFVDAMAYCNGMDMVAYLNSQDLMEASAHYKSINDVVNTNLTVHEVLADVVDFEEEAPSFWNQLMTRLDQTITTDQLPFPQEDLVDAAAYFDSNELLNVEASSRQDTLAYFNSKGSVERVDNLTAGEVVLPDNVSKVLDEVVDFEGEVPSFGTQVNDILRDMKRRNELAKSGCYGDYVQNEATITNSNEHVQQFDNNGLLPQVATSPDTELMGTADKELLNLTPSDPNSSDEPTVEQLFCSVYADINGQADSNAFDDLFEVDEDRLFRGVPDFGYQVHLNNNGIG